LLLGLLLGAGYGVQAPLFAASLKHLEAGLADPLYFAYPAMVAAARQSSAENGGARVAASGSWRRAGELSSL
jgi:hypothetical protein